MQYQPSGLFLLDKRPGYSSAQAIALLKRRLNIKKIGHAGTLDPFATGLLVCLVNSATKIADRVQSGEKTYSGIIRLGLVTDSDDITGQVISESADLPEAERVLTVANSFMGPLMQIPPQVSAIKVGGMRAYEKKRRGEDFKIEARPTEIFFSEFKLLDSANLFFRLKTAKGFYVRSFARDLGEMLGCGATLAELRREASMPFMVEQAKFVDHLDWSDLIDSTTFAEEQRT